ncbi:hypothetical protein HK104_010887 [Borealophlyctis nickersoniae]|nr:hypothetical protein HK104_010887 [Borealophlyctis nickersoniae]
MFRIRGGYSRGSEDHRWPMLRKIIGNGVAWHLFNFFFISCYQNVLLLLISVPAYIVHRAAVLSPVHLRIATPAPAISLAVFAFLLIFEAIADAQQWAFQTKKYAAIAESKKTGVPVKPPYAKGFLAEGLFRLSRHPNYFAEIGMWWCVYAYSVAAQWEGRLLTKNWIRDYINWSMCGAVLLTLLFEGSTAFTEWISAKKYPAYKLYQQTTSVLVPMWPGPKIESLETKDKKEK